MSEYFDTLNSKKHFRDIDYRNLLGSSYPQFEMYKQEAVKLAALGKFDPKHQKIASDVMDI